MMIWNRKRKIKCVWKWHMRSMCNNYLYWHTYIHAYIRTSRLITVWKRIFPKCIRMLWTLGNFKDVPRSPLDCAAKGNIINVLQKISSNSEKYCYRRRYVCSKSMNNKKHKANCKKNNNNHAANTYSYCMINQLSH